MSRTAVSLKTPLVKYRKGEENCPLDNEYPHDLAPSCSLSPAISWPSRWPSEGGISFIYGSQSHRERGRYGRPRQELQGGLRRFRLQPGPRLPPWHDVLDLKDRTGHSTIAITADGTANGKLLGIVTSRDYRVSRMAPDDARVSTFMTPIEKLVTAPEDTTLKDCQRHHLGPQAQRPAHRRCRRAA